MHDFANGKFWDALWDAYLIAGGGVVVLWVNMLVYRAFLHPLSRAGELSISDPSAIIPLLGYNSRARKGPFYGALEPSLHTNRDAEFHRSQRKIWDNAFKQSLSDYGASIEEFTFTLLSRLQRSLGKEVDINELCMFYSYDAVHDGVMAVGALVHIPWILTVVESISFAGPIRQFNLWSAEQVELRRNVNILDSRNERCG